MKPNATGGAATPDHAAQVRSLRDASNAAIAARDADRVVSFMDASVVVLVAGGLELTTVEANRRAFAEQMRDASFRGYVRTPTQVDIVQAPLRALEHGRWVGRWQTKRDVQELSGPYTAEWHLTPLGWRIVRETFRSA